MRKKLTGGIAKGIDSTLTPCIRSVRNAAPNISGRVHEGVAAMESHESADELARICHAPPTLSEAVHEAAQAVDKRAIHETN